MMTEVIHTDNLTKRFGTFTAVDHISFDVHHGEVFGFLGANGAGKTTAMRMLCGLSKPTSGTGTVAGYDIARQPEMVKKHIGYMSQKFSLYEDMTVKENLVLFGGIYGMSRKEIAEKTDVLLNELNFSSEKNTMVKELPLGWKRKTVVLGLDLPQAGNRLSGRTDWRGGSGGKKAVLGTHLQGGR